MSATIFDLPPDPVALPLDDLGSSARAQGLTLETALWLVLGLAALGLRFVALGQAPLSEGEASLAYEAWRWTVGQPYDLSGGGLSLLAFNLTALAFALFGAGDAIARVAPALAGVGLVLAPWLLRPLLGRGPALAMAGLLLLSPVALFWSRQASGEGMAAFLALLLVAGVARWLRWGAARDAALAAVALGLGLASGPGFWTVLVAGGLVLGWGWVRGRGREGERGGAGEGERGSRGEPENGPVGIGNDPPSTDHPQPSISKVRSPISHLPSLSRYGLLALGVFLLAATGLLTNLPGLGAALGLPVAWARGVFGAGAPLAVPFFLTLLLYEPFLVLAGAIGAGRLLGIAPGWTRFALLWAAVTLIPATLTNSGWSAGLLWTVLPLTLLAGVVVAPLLRAALAEGTWRAEGALVIASLGLLLYLWIVLVSFLSSPSPQKTIQLIAALVAWAGTAALIATYVGVGAARRGLALSVLAVALVAMVSTGWGVAVRRATDPREPLVVQPGDPNLRTVAAQLWQVASERYREPAEMPIAIETTLGVGPRWYLRGFRDVRLVEGSYADLPEAALLEAQAPAPPDRIGQRVWLGRSWQWAAPATRADFLRWLQERESPSGLTERTGTLYLTVP